ncbi:two component system sensor histidine kinase, hybrid [Desulfosarcina variabilis str. Montpellier]|uniref:PAS domain-containing hybrid sensor histidine kinase/response regulator n=1 Tax=Desulfosarcina variabilis TaxID=2300 RepID=UPI003AFA6F94
MNDLTAENKKLREKVRRLEEEKESWRRAQFITNAADQLLTMIDRNYTYESVNEAYCRARGQRRNNVVGKSVAAVWGDEQFQSIIKPKLDHCFTGQLTSSEHWFKFDGQALRCYQVTYNPYYDNAGQVTHAVVVTHDITAMKRAEAALQSAHDRLERRVTMRTEALLQANEQLRNEIEERKRMEKALRESDNRYRSVSRDMPAMVCRYLPDGTLTFANFKFRQYFQVGKRQTEKTNIFDFCGGVGRQRKQQRLKDLSPAKPMVTYEQFSPTEKGEPRWHQWTDRALFDEIGNAMEYQSIGIDITKKKEFESKLQQAQKMEAIGTLAGGIAHDFNNLLMGIQGNISLMYLDLDENHPLYENLRSIEQLVDSGAKLTRQLLGFARGGKYVVKPVNLNEVVAKTAALFGRTRKSIRIHETYDPTTCTVLADRGQIEQVLINLYLNGWQAMSKQGDLYLETKRVKIDKDFIKPFEVCFGDYIRVSVTDSGQGIDPTISHRIFDPFFTTKEFGSGSGLGLASVFGIIKNHDGIVDFETQPGKGTTFNVYLPVCKATETEIPHRSVGIISGPETILLVDDESYILDVGEKMLRKMGYTVIRAACGEEAVRIFTDVHQTIDLVILDMIMPDISGHEVYDRLKDVKSDIKVLLASGDSRGDAATTINKGCNGFIQKPFNMEKLSHAIRDVIDNDYHQPSI